MTAGKPHRDLNINQRSAWFAAHGLRVALAQGGSIFSGPAEVDEIYFEFAARHNLREADTIDIMGTVADDMAGKRPRYRELIADNGLASGARA